MARQSKELLPWRYRRCTQQALVGVLRAGDASLIPHVEKHSRVSNMHISEELPLG
jgi:hypothetical protein